MSFLWHGLTEQGAQVPVQVDAQGRVIAVDGTPGVSNWERTGTTLSPAVSGDSVDIGSGNITLNASGSAEFKDQVKANGLRVTDYIFGVDAPFTQFAPTHTETDATIAVRNSGAANYYYTVATDGTTYIGNNTGAGNNATGGRYNIRLKSDGSAEFKGNVTAPNITFRSADPQFYAKKSKNNDGLPEYVGPELDLLAEIARLEALVRHLYETLRLAPPAGWPVWDGNDDVLRQLRK